MSQGQLVNSTSSGGVVLLKDDEMRSVMELDETLQACKTQLIETQDKPMLKSIILARATNAIRKLLTDKMMGDIMQLMGSPLGFRTDRDREEKSYAIGDVRDVAIVAMLDGARLVGNEFNIIAGNYYRTKEQLKRRILEWPGISNFWYELQVPNASDKGALVGCVATWKVNGHADEIACTVSDKGDFRIPVRVNSGQGADAILGKAERKLFWKVWQRLMGQDVQDWDPDESTDAPDLEQTIDATISKPAATDELSKALAACVSLTQVTDTKARFRDRIPEDQLELLCEARRNEIRSTRGEKAKQGTFV